MNKGEEADADDLASEFETGQTRQKIRRDLAKFRRRLHKGTAATKNTDLYMSDFFQICCRLNENNYVFGFFHQGKIGQVRHL